MFVRFLNLSIVRDRSEKGACLFLNIRAFDAHSDEHKISTETSTLFSQLVVRIITDALRNVDVCFVDVMFLVQSHVDLPSTFGGEANALSNHVGFACDTYKYPSISDITREDHGLVYGEVNVSGPERGIPKKLIKL